MTFYKKEATARSNTVKLVCLFVVSVFGTAAAMYVPIAIFILYCSMSKRSSIAESHAIMPSFQGFEICLLACLAIILLACAYKRIELLAGGKAVAHSCGARLIGDEPDPDEKRFVNVVQEMSIASCTPVPQLYVLDQEFGINAFVAGYNRGDTVMVITRGALKKLNREELQGVVGHEFSHIFNGDMRLSMELISFIFGIAIIAEFGRLLAESRSDRDSLSLNILGLALWLFGSVGAACAEAIQSGVSRQREWLADASSTRYTRNPVGLAGALKKIAALSGGSSLGVASANQLNHMMLADARTAFFGNMFDSHPPILERIKAIDPQFKEEDLTDIEDPSIIPDQFQQSYSAGSFSTESSSAPADANTAAGKTAGPVLSPMATALGAAIVGNLSAEIPYKLVQLSKTSMGATAAIYALLVSHDDEIRAKQLALLSAPELQLVYNELTRALPAIQTMDSQFKLPLACLCAPALRTLKLPQFEQFRNSVIKMVEADDKLDIFEFALMKLVLANLDESFNPKSRKATIYDVKFVSDECRVILSALAHLSENSVDAFKVGTKELGLESLSLMEGEHCALHLVDSALNKIRELVIEPRAHFMSACVLVAEFDGKITLEECQLLQAIANVLDCPPPFARPSAIS